MIINLEQQVVEREILNKYDTRRPRELSRLSDDRGYAASRGLEKPPQGQAYRAN